MHAFRRKLQLVAGATYTISLPKSWVLEQGLRVQNELTIIQQDDASLIINTQNNPNKFPLAMSLEIETYERNIETVIFALYYKGVESIDLYAKKVISAETKKRIRSALLNMSGTEIVYEDPKKISIKVMINKDNVDFFQVIYRMVLLIALSITNLTENFDHKELQMNEDEVDRLYNLSTKILSSSLHSSSMLKSSKINSLSIIPSLFIINKRLENISDNLQIIGTKYVKKGISSEPAKKVLLLISSLLQRCAKYWLGKQTMLFQNTQGKEIIEIEKFVESIDDARLRSLVRETFRFTKNIEEELVIASFYQQL